MLISAAVLPKILLSETVKYVQANIGVMLRFGNCRPCALAEHSKIKEKNG